MNKEVKELIEPYNPNIKKGTWYITSGTRDIKKPYLLARLEELEEENKLLKEKLDQLEENTKDAINHIKANKHNYSLYDLLRVEEILERR